MFIKSITLEGFKSYAQNTVIDLFDRQFNAITGLNGSGKSNILDAVCFVMGISSLNHMRASNLQELIYKVGKAGINKASVSITFDNTDKKTSPIGYQDYDTLIITRTIYQSKSKYYINGYSETQEKVKNLFMSVRLNINNPHFLIMQGKVTKVVNMKPVEILGLLEETSGTSIYESKKDSSIKLIKKKENKLEEIQKLISENITPSLEKLRKEKQDFFTWKTKDTEFQELNKYLTAYEYYTTNVNLNSKGSERENYENLRTKEQLDLNKVVHELMYIETEIKKLEINVDSDSDKNIQDLDIQVKKLKIEVKNLEVQKKNTNKYIENSNKEIIKNNMNSNKTNMNIQKLEAEVLNMDSNHEIYEKDLENNNERLKELERNLENVGKESASNIKDSAFNLNKMIQDNMTTINKTEQENKNKESQIKLLDEEMNSKSKEITALKSNNLKDAGKKKNEIEKNMNKIQRDMENLNIDSKEVKELEAKLKFDHNDISELYNKMNYAIQSSNTKNNYIKYTTDFRDPESSFDRSKIKGRVIKLFQVEDSKYIKALEGAAMWKLFNIVVDSNDTSKALLNNRCLDGSNTFIPMNKIDPPFIHNNLKEKVKQYGQDAQFAIDLVKFDEKYRTTMRYVFGNVVICSNAKICKEIAYNNDKTRQAKCITLEGDEFDNGTMKGGASGFNAIFGTISKARDLFIIESQLESKKKETRDTEQKFKIAREKLFSLTSLREKLKTLEIALDLNSEEKILVKIQQLEADIQSNKDSITMNNKRKTDNNSMIVNLNKEIKKLKEEEKELVQINSNKNDVKSAKEMFNKKIKERITKIKECTDKIKGNTKDTNKLKNQIKEKQNDLVSIQDNINEEQKSIGENNKKIEEIEFTTIQTIQNKETKEIKLMKMKMEFSKNQEAIEKLNEEHSRKNKSREEHDYRLKKLEKQLEQRENDLKEGVKKLEVMDKEHTWIHSEKEFFNQKGTFFDFENLTEENSSRNNKNHDSNNDLDSLQNKVEKLREECKSLKRKVNLKADAIAVDLENQYTELMKRKDILTNDKYLIEKTIADLDIKRKEALEEIYEVVNKNLNSIYSTLLPGAQAKLNRVDTESLMKGLELKVGFNNTWKKSLSELSGGQRSLLALSLILSLLLYKPAPLYILDEIDAALDLSHTSNLGVMIKEHFPQSQFIIVSLKDGMFNNANVLYSVTYVEGSSKVSRTVFNMSKNIGNQLVKKVDNKKMIGVGGKSDDNNNNSNKENECNRMSNN